MMKQTQNVQALVCTYKNPWC